LFDNNYLKKFKKIKLDKAKKALDLEYHDLEDKLNQVQSACNRALAERKKFETDAITASDELHEVKFELRGADEKVNSIYFTVNQRIWKNSRLMNK
jgi:chromosome segregation ATPase